MASTAPIAVPGHASLYELAQHAGINYTTVSRVRDGQRWPTRRTTLALAKAMDMDVVAFWAWLVADWRSRGIEPDMVGYEIGEQPEEAETAAA